MKFNPDRFDKIVAEEAKKMGLDPEAVEQGEFELNGKDYCVISAPALQMQQEIWKRSIKRYVEELK